MSEDDITVSPIGTPPITRVVGAQIDGRPVPVHVPERAKSKKGDVPWVVRDQMDFGQGAKAPAVLETYTPQGVLQQSQPVAPRREQPNDARSIRDRVELGQGENHVDRVATYGPKDFGR